MSDAGITLLSHVLIIHGSFRSIQTAAGEWLLCLRVEETSYAIRRFKL